MNRGPPACQWDGCENSATSPGWTYCEEHAEPYTRSAWLQGAVEHEVEGEHEA